MKKIVVLLLCILLGMSMIACSQNSTDESSNPAKDNLSKYEQEFYAIHDNGIKTTVVWEGVTYVFSLSEDGACTLVYSESQEVDGLQIGSEKIDVQFTSTYYMYYQGVCTTADNVYNCTFDTRYIAMKNSEGFTKEIKERYLQAAKDAGMVDENTLQYFTDLLNGEALEDTTGDFVSLAIALEKDGDTLRLLNIDSKTRYQTTSLTFGESTITSCEYHDNWTETYVYDLQGTLLSQTQQYGDHECSTIHYYPNGNIRLECSTNAEGITMEERHYDENGSLTYHYQRSWNDSTSHHYYYENDILTREVRCYESGQTFYETLFYPVINPETNYYLEKSSHYYTEDGILYYSLERPDSNAPDTYTLYDRRTLDDGSIKVYKYEYVNGNCTLFFLYDGDGNVLSREESTYYENGNLHTYTQYDADGNVTSYTELDPAGNRIGGSFWIDNTYYVDYADGSREATTYYEDGSVQGYYKFYPNGSQACYYIYDENGELTEWAEYDKAGNIINGITRYGCYLHEFSNGIMVSRTEFYDNGSVKEYIRWNETGMPVANYEYEENGDLFQWYECDDQGNIINGHRYEEWESSDGTEGYTWSTYENGHIISEYSYLSDGTPDDWSEYYYDASGNLTEWYLYNGDGSLRILREYTYSDAGMLAIETWTYGTGQYARITYNDAGLRIEYYSEIGGVVRKWEKYIYDDNGNLIETIDLLD